jgi:MFS family permease
MTSASLDQRAEVQERDPASGKRIWRVGTLTYTPHTLALLFVWLLGGDFALAIRDRAIPPIIQILFKQFEASDFLTAIIFASIPAALSVIINPVVAYNSDRLRTRWGRRIPFMFASVPFIVVSTVGLAFSPQLGTILHTFLGSHSPGLNSSCLIVLAVCWTIFEIGCVTTFAILGALMNDVVPQVVMGRFYGLFRAVGLMAGIAFFLNVLGEAKAHYAWIFLGVGAIYAVAFTVMCWKVKEGVPPAILDDCGGRPGIFSAVKTYFRDGFGNPYYLWYFAVMMLGGLSAAPVNIFSLYFSESYGISDGTYGKWIACSYAVSLLLSYPIGIAADRFHPLRLSIVGLAIYAVTMGCAGFLVHDATSFGAAFILHNILSGSLATAWASLPQRILPRARFAEIGSACGMVGAVASIVITPFFGRILDVMNHDYRYTFFMTAVMSAFALGAFLVLHTRFMALGGPARYTSPE